MEEEIMNPKRYYETVNPATDADIVIEKFEFLTDEQLQEKIKNSAQGFQVNSKLTIEEKKQKLHNLSDLINKNKQNLAEIITTEMGKPITQSLSEVSKAADFCQYYYENIEHFLTPTKIKTENKQSFVQLQPTGTVLMITPFNYPFWLPFKSGIPSLALGNAVLARPSETTPRTNQAIEKLMIDAGFVNFEFQNIFSTYEQTEIILQNPSVSGVSFTGSTRTGSKIGELAGKNLKKSVLELGGNDPFIVLKNADVDLAVKLAVDSRISNCGQTCTAAKRFIIQEEVYNEFKEKLIKKLQTLKIGDPMDPTTELGPLANNHQKLVLIEQLYNSIIENEDNVEILHGGHCMETETEKHTHFFLPTVLEVQKDNPICKEEVFGPVFTLLKVKSTDEAVELANDTVYGLGSIVVTKDEKLAKEISEKLQSGSVFVNSVTKSDKRLPSGGTKSSGFGRECGDYGIKEFANIKTVVIN